MNAKLDAEIDRLAALMLVSVMSRSERDVAVSAFGKHAYAASKLLPDAGTDGLRWLLHEVAFRCVHAIQVNAEGRLDDVGTMIVRNSPLVFDNIAAFVDAADFSMRDADALAGWLRRVVDLARPPKRAQKE